ncbi:MAG: hypothetical protein GY763_09635 [Gammaproteobacteria bacterium]|nr:hypothetical protein [Gammaproteobacteria bacterium]
MFSLILFLFVTLLAAAGVFLFVRYNIELSKAQNRAQQSERQTTRKPIIKRASSITQWRSVKLEPGLMCCNHAAVMRNKIFLAAEAPQFPLARCDKKDCNCKYVHLEDRRDGDDRRQTTEYNNQIFDLHQQNRRKTRGRRVTDMGN